MVFIFFAFSIQKWNQYTAEMLVPLISHSPVVFWLIPAFGVRGAGYFLGTTETIFGSLILFGYWSARLGNPLTGVNLPRRNTPGSPKIVSSAGSGHVFLRALFWSA
jgi:uncharacterized membrane protein YkgB